MPTPTFPQTTIAIVWDFDNTLIPGSMQKPIFQHYGIEEAKFWREVNGLARFYEGRNIKVNRSTAYLNHMLTYVDKGLMGDLNNELLESFGGQINFYRGLPGLFPDLQKVLHDNPEFRKYDISLEHYIVSTGLVRMIRGSAISKHVDGVWGCEFIENVAEPDYILEYQVEFNAKNSIKQVAYALDDTTKTRAIFEINKGTNLFPEIGVNDSIPHEARRIPFKNMIYVADGPSDIPVFSLLNQYEGRTFAVFDPNSEENFSQVYAMQRQGRVEAYGPTDYTSGTQTYMWLKETVNDIASRIKSEKDFAMNTAVRHSPIHLPDTPHSLAQTVEGTA